MGRKYYSASVTLTSTGTISAVDKLTQLHKLLISIVSCAQSCTLLLCHHAKDAVLPLWGMEVWVTKMSGMKVRFTQVFEIVCRF